MSDRAPTPDAFEELSPSSLSSSLSTASTKDDGNSNKSSLRDPPALTVEPAHAAPISPAVDHPPAPDVPASNAVHSDGLDNMVGEFIDRIMALAPGTVDLSPSLAPSLSSETVIRRLLALEPTSPVLEDHYLGLLSVFDAPAQLRVIRNRIPQSFGPIGEQEFWNLLMRSNKESQAKYELLFGNHVLVINPRLRREEGSPSTVRDLADFKGNWDLFTSGFLSAINWDNVVAAGGSVLACLQGASQDADGKYFHLHPPYNRSDVDLFIWGLNNEEAKDKMDEIFSAIKAAVRWDMICIRKRHVVTVYSQFPYRPIQIVLRLYRSPAEILAGFDVDCACVAFDGQKVWANPRAIVALMRQCNTVDVSRRSPSYEMRLSKYAARGYEVLVPGLDRAAVEQSLFNYKRTKFPNGLARLLVLERVVGTQGTYYHHLKSPEHTLTHVGKNNPRGHRATLAALETCGYDSAIVFIPYGPNWNASCIRELFHRLEKTVEMVHTFPDPEADQNSDLYASENTEENAHFHSMFISDTMRGCFHDMCPQGICYPPEDPLLADKYIRGPLTFIAEDPGRQMISGSFNPIDDDQWEAEAYAY